MDEEDVRNGQGAQDLGGAGGAAHEHPGRQHAAVGFRACTPGGGPGVKEIRDDIHPAPAELEHQRHPDEVAETHHEGAHGDEVGGLGDGGGEAGPRGTEKSHGHLGDEKGRTGRAEGGQEDGPRRQADDVVLVALRPGVGSGSVLGVDGRNGGVLTNSGGLRCRSKGSGSGSHRAYARGRDGGCPACSPRPRARPRLSATWLPL